MFYTTEDPDAESILATVKTEDLILYLDESAMTMEEIMERVGFTRGSRSH